MKTIDERSPLAEADSIQDPSVTSPVTSPENDSHDGMHDARRQAVERIHPHCHRRGRQRLWAFFEEILNDEEGHVDYLEGQLHAIEEMGIENYLAQQLHMGTEEKD